MKDKFRQHFSEALALLLIAALAGLLTSVLLPQRATLPQSPAVSINSSESPIVSRPSSIVVPVQTGDQSSPSPDTSQGRATTFASVSTAAMTTVKAPSSLSHETAVSKLAVSPSSTVAAKAAKNTVCATPLKPVVAVASKLTTTLPLLSDVTAELSTCPA